MLNGTSQADFAPMRFSKTLGTEKLKSTINYSWHQDPTAGLLSEQWKYSSRGKELGYRKKQLYHADYKDTLFNQSEH